MPRPRPFSPKTNTLKGTTTMTFLLNDTFIRRHLTPDLRNTRVAPCLLGMPAIGKTSAVNALESEGEFKVFSIDVNTLSDAADLTGVRTVEDPDKPGRFIQVFFPHQTIQEANDYALENPDVLVVIMLDEINRTSSDVTSAALTLQTSRRCGNLRLAANIRFIVTGNDKGNITMLDSASLSRFSLYPVRPDARVLIRILADTIQPAIRDTLTEHPELITSMPTPKGMVSAAEDDDDDDAYGVSDAQLSRFAEQMDDTQDMAQFTAPRTIEGLNLWLNEVGNEELAEMANETALDADGVETTELMLALRAHTGDTLFTTEVHARLTNQLLAPAAATSTGITVHKPAFWDDLRSAGSQTEVENILGALGAEEQTDGLVFAMTTRNEGPLVRRVVDTVIALGQVSAISPEAQRTLLNRGTSGALNDESVNYLLSKNAPLVSSLATIANFLTS